MSVQFKIMKTFELGLQKSLDFLNRLTSSHFAPKAVSTPSQGIPQHQPN